PSADSPGPRWGWRRRLNRAGPSMTPCRRRARNRTAGPEEAVRQPTDRTRNTERRTTHVEVLRDLFADAGSTPAGSIRTVRCFQGTGQFLLMDAGGGRSLTRVPRRFAAHAGVPCGDLAPLGSTPAGSIRTVRCFQGTGQFLLMDAGGGRSLTRVPRRFAAHAGVPCGDLAPLGSTPAGSIRTVRCFQGKIGRAS